MRRISLSRQIRITRSAMVVHGHFHSCTNIPAPKSKWSLCLHLRSTLRKLGSTSMKDCQSVGQEIEVDETWIVTRKKEQSTSDDRRKKLRKIGNVIAGRDPARRRDRQITERMHSLSRTRSHPQSENLSQVQCREISMTEILNSQKHNP